MIFLIFGGFRAVGFGGVSGSVVEYVSIDLYKKKFARYGVLDKIILDRDIKYILVF